MPSVFTLQGPQIGCSMCPQPSGQIGTLYEMWWYAVVDQKTGAVEGTGTAIPASTPPEQGPRIFWFPTEAALKEFVAQRRPVGMSKTVRVGLFALGGAALLGVAYLFVRHDRRRGLRGPRKRKPKEKFTVYDYEIDPNSGATTRIRESIDTAAPGDYGADPIGPNSDGVFMFRMVPSGDVVDFEERERRLKARKAGLRGPSMLQVIAKESRTAEEFARRAEAWNSSERDPLSVKKLAAAYKKAKPSTVAKLIREAHEQRIEGRERMWSRMSRGLRGDDSLNERQRSALVFATDHRGFVSAGVGSKWGPMRDLATLKALAKRGYLEFYGKGKVAGGYAYDRYQYRITDAGRAAIDRGLRGLRQTPGGKARGMRPSQFNPRDLDAGTKVEFEHTSDPAIARKIAMDHLVEDRDYYRKLKQVHLDGYRVAYGTSGGGRTYRVYDERTLDNLEHAKKLMRAYKRQGLWTWIEDEQGNFVPVPGAMRESVRKGYPPR